MGRIKLSLPEKFHFVTEIPLRIGDINYGGHLGNDSVLSLAHEARMRFLNTMGYSEMDVAGVALIMTDAVVVYKGQGTYGMVTEIKAAVDDLQLSGFDLLFQITDQATGREIARVKTGMAFFSYERQRPVKAPEEFIAKINSL